MKLKPLNTLASGGVVAEVVHPYLAIAAARLPNDQRPCVATWHSKGPGPLATAQPHQALKETSPSHLLTSRKGASQAAKALLYPGRAPCPGCSSWRAHVHWPCVSHTPITTFLPFSSAQSMASAMRHPAARQLLITAMQLTSFCSRRFCSSRAPGHGPGARQFNVTAVAATPWWPISRPSAATWRQRGPQAAMELLKLMLSASKEISLKPPSTSRAFSQWPQRALPNRKCPESRLFPPISFQITRVMPQQHKGCKIVKKTIMIQNSLVARRWKFPQSECGMWLGDIRAELMTPRSSCESHEANGHSHALRAATHASAGL